MWRNNSYVEREKITNRTSLSNKFGKKTESVYVITVDVPNQFNVRNVEIKLFLYSGKT
jgi:hypothetical protein